MDIGIDEDDEVTDIREQIFHNTVREQIVSVPYFVKMWKQKFFTVEFGTIFFIVFNGIDIPANICIIIIFLTVTVDQKAKQSMLLIPNINSTDKWTFVF